MENLESSFSDAVFILLQAAVSGAILVWGVCMGSVFSGLIVESTPFKKLRLKPTKKVVLFSMPIMLLVAFLIALYGFKNVINPGETRGEALYDAQITFFCVLLPLWSGCLWNIFNLYKESHEQLRTTNSPH